VNTGKAVKFGEEHETVVITMADLIEADHDLHQIQLDADEQWPEMTNPGELVKKARAIFRRLHDEGWEQSRCVQIDGAPCIARYIKVIDRR
jgi:hypothetical protein